MNAIQMLLDGMTKQWQEERAKSQMTLGELIKVLDSMPSELELKLGELRSYRGYYSDLAFAPDEKRLVSEILADCRAAMGEVFDGYKGGEYVMGSKTPLWVAHYGSCGRKLMSVKENGEVVTAEDDTI